MDPQAISVLVNLGIGGVGLYLFANGTLLTKKVVDQIRVDFDKRLAQVVALYEARLKAGDQRYNEMKADRDEWKGLTLGSERRLTAAIPAVAAAVGVAPGVPSGHQAPESG